MMSLLLTLNRQLLNTYLQTMLMLKKVILHFLQKAFSMRDIIRNEQ